MWGGVSANTLPVPMMNIINGGSHSDAPIAFQNSWSFLLRNFIHPCNANGDEIFAVLKKYYVIEVWVLWRWGTPTLAGGTEDTLDTIKLAVENWIYVWWWNHDCFRCAAEFYVNGKYDYSKFEGGETGKIRSSAEQVDYLAELVAKSQLSLSKTVWMKTTGMDGITYR
jgi:enolase